MGRTVSRRFVSPILSTIFSLFFLLFCSATDTIAPYQRLRDGKTLVSAGKTFELGFFSPGGSSNQKRYVGIWYYGLDPQTVVWVANRDVPLSDSSGVFANDENLKVLDRNNKTVWSTSIPSAKAASAKLLDSGNFILQEGNHDLIWQSYDQPSDTFLPGMNLEVHELTSWKNESDPSLGDFTFSQQRKQFIIKNGPAVYWKSGTSDDSWSFDEIPGSILSNFKSRNCRINSSSPYNSTIPCNNTTKNNRRRLMMHPSGQIRYLEWKEKTRMWDLTWSEPSDSCSVYKACGAYGSCNSNSKPVCKCLPGFRPNSLKDWDSGQFSGGCTKKTTECGKKDVFFELKKMKVEKTESVTESKGKNETECRAECLENCKCKAYSYEASMSRGDSSSTCWFWEDELIRNLQEDYPKGGKNLYIRVARSDFETTRRSCGICGTNTIPYPLSTGPSCGDPAYFSFHCINSTDQLRFDALNGSSYAVTRINPETRTFVIQLEDAATCGATGSSSKELQMSNSFYMANTTMLLNCSEGVEIEWEPPLEPMCNSSNDCREWPNSTCKPNTTVHEKKQCICNENFRWDSANVNCTQDHVGDTNQFKQFKETSRNKRPLSLMVHLTNAIGILLFCTGISIYFLRRRRIVQREIHRDNIQEHPMIHLDESDQSANDFTDSNKFREDKTKGIDVPFFDLESILAATENFSNSNKLGQGGFGPVYKGKLPGGQEIAVKRLSRNSGQVLEEFKNEVLLIAKLQHRNLVRLLGYCIKGDEKMLLYEYMPNKSLDSILFDRTQCLLLNWEKRFDIILGIARGLLYLHQDSRLRIIHRDLKTSNILLDEEMNPKISDFGTARIFGGKQTEANTNRVVGTYGYMSPEYALDGFFSVKSDVFSFGVVLLEIISGKKNTGYYQTENALSLIGYTWSLWKEEKVLDLMDQSLCESCNRGEVLKCIIVGLLCVQEDANDRPTMSNVVFMLGSETATLPTPKHPAFVARRSVLSTGASSSRTAETCSNKEITVTVEEGR